MIPPVPRGSINHDHGIFGYLTNLTSFNIFPRLVTFDLVPCPWPISLKWKRKWVPIYVVCLLHQSSSKSATATSGDLWPGTYMSPICLITLFDQAYPATLTFVLHMHPAKRVQVSSQYKCKCTHWTKWYWLYIPLFSHIVLICVLASCRPSSECSFVFNCNYSNTPL